MLGGNIMNDKSKDLLKKMCSVLKVVRQVCLISFALLIGLSLFMPSTRMYIIRYLEV